MAVLALAAPVVAQSVDIVVTVDAAAKTLNIGYVNNGVPAADLPVGLALEVSVAGGQVTGAGTADAVDFPVYLDAASDDPDNYNIGDGTPLAADPCAPGALTTFPVSDLVVCMARLDPCAPGPNPGPASVDLVALDILPSAMGGYATDTMSVTIAANPNRGGVVGGGAAFSTNLPITLSGIPSCWFGTTQCHGDTNNDTGNLNTTDFFAFKDAYNQTYAGSVLGTGIGEYNPCADLNQDGAINTTDFFEFKDTYSGANPNPPVADCPAAGSTAIVVDGIWPPS
jgi:hypothetical protein